MQKWLLDITFLYDFKLAQLCLVLQYKIQKNTLSRARLVSLIYFKQKNINPSAIFALGVSAGVFIRIVTELA